MESRASLRANSYRDADERYSPGIQDEFAWSILVGRQFVVKTAHLLRYAAASLGGAGRLARNSNTSATMASTAAV
jgi:hypothetical protein